MLNRKLNKKYKTKLYCEHMEEVEKENEASVEGQGMCEERTKTAVPTGQSQREEWTEENGRDGRVRCVFVFCVWRWYQETIICCDWKVKWYVWNKLALTVCWLCFVPFVSLSLSFSSFALLLWSSLWLSCLLLVSCFFYSFMWHSFLLVLWHLRGLSLDGSQFLLIWVMSGWKW